MSHRIASRFHPSQRSSQAPSRVTTLPLTLPASNPPPACLHPLQRLLDHSPRLRSTPQGLSTRHHRSLRDRMLYLPSQIRLAPLSAAGHLFLLSLIAAKAHQPSLSCLLSITTTQSRSPRSLTTRSTASMLTLLLLHQDQLPTSLANYLLGRCLCPLIRFLPDMVCHLTFRDRTTPDRPHTLRRPTTPPVPDMTLPWTDTLRAGATKTR